MVMALVGHSWAQTWQPIHAATCTGSSIIQARDENSPGMGLSTSSLCAPSPSPDGRVISRQRTGQRSIQMPQLMQVC
jgi:hypothetical protein